ncbi:hypothetical protein, partial [Staphylococcus epidermidis]|uniref:hypothetical protein n=1 Tax=Staphylococcus epidermidis TaxID=1282 RepID=UPI001642A3C1
NNGDGCIEEITENKIGVEEGSNGVKEGKEDLRGDRSCLKSEVGKLSRRGERNKKKGRSVSGYKNSIDWVECEIRETENRGNTMMNKGIGCVEEVNNVLDEVKELKEGLRDRIKLLEGLGNKERLKEGGNGLESKIN